ncbi:MAG: TolC family protein [Bryobacterales bacterium]
MRIPIVLLTSATALSICNLSAQDSTPERPSRPLTIQTAVELAARNYPAIRASLAEVAAAEGGIDLAKTAYLPQAGLRVGVNRATRNNVFGLIFSNGVIPAISGPVQDESTITSTFGSSAGVLFSYEPFDFGLRHANVQVAEALKARAEAGRAVTEYEVTLAAADAYLQAAATERAVGAAKANVDRMQVFHDAVDVLVKNDLRPGADSSRARAELARARSELIRAEEEAAKSLATLAEWLGLAGEAVAIQPASLAGDPPAADLGSASLQTHPFAAGLQAEIAVAEARRAALEKEWRPTFQAQAAVFGRGTGARIDGTFKGGGNGLAPSEGNWAVGFNMDFDLFDYKQNRVKRQIETHNLERDRARRDTVLQELQGEVARARIAVDAARKIAANTPIELDAARTLETQAQARYKAQLGTVVEVAEAQRLLRQAEVDDALARLGVWRALFALAAAQGEMDELLTAASR